MIIVEGPDGSGKSALIELLHKMTGMDVFHRGGPPVDREEALKQMSRTFTQFGMILDRTIFVSEIVYGHALRGKTVVDQELLWEGLRRLVGMNALFVFCRPKDGTLRRAFEKSITKLKAWKTKEHCQEVTEKFDEIVAGYDWIYEELKQLGAKVLIYEWEKKI